MQINPTLAVVDKNHMALIRLLEKYGIDGIPLVEYAEVPRQIVFSNFN